MPNRHLAVWLFVPHVHRPLREHVWSSYQKLSENRWLSYQVNDFSPQITSLTSYHTGATCTAHAPDISPIFALWSAAPCQRETPGEVPAGRCSQASSEVAEMPDHYCSTCWLTYGTTSPQPFTALFSGTTQVSRCQKRTSGLYDAKED